MIDFVSKNQTQDYDYSHLFLGDIPLMDVRAPVEFNKGAFPHAVNCPLLDDNEREAIGTRYKQQGQNAAIELGHELVQGDAKARKLATWLEFAEQHSKGMLYCFRGGLRSQMTQQWMAEAGVNVEFIPGGYKAMRRFLIDTLEEQAQQQSMVIISGRTGTGKTRVLHQIKHRIDLEGRANHRGSAFGRMPGGQPSQINFENHIAIDLLKLEHRHAPAVFLEDESRLVGRCAVPPVLLNSMGKAPMIMLESSAAERTQLTLEDYVLNYWPKLQLIDPDNADRLFREHFIDAIYRIRRRLGPERYGYLNGLFEAAIETFLDSPDGNKDAEGFREAFHLLLTEYYDPMYDYQLSKKQGEIIFRGEADEVVAFADNYRPE